MVDRFLIPPAAFLLFRPSVGYLYSIFDVCSCLFRCAFIPRSERETKHRRISLFFSISLRRYRDPPDGMPSKRDGTLPKYMVREFGEGTPKGKVYAINPAMIIVLVPMITAATSSVDPLVMIHWQLLLHIPPISPRLHPGVLAGHEARTGVPPSKELVPSPREGR